jgi:ribonuclease G
MYNDADAVARIDSYIVSVTGGGPYVGERKLVRIEEVERAAAIASLLGGESPNGNGNGASGEEGLESDAPARKRSRGRRGGRGRSRAKQGSTDE